MVARIQNEDRQALLTARAEEAARLGSWELDLESGDLLWSDNMFRIVGVAPNEVSPDLDYVFMHVHVDDRRSVEAFIAKLSDEVSPPPLEYRWVLSSGEARYMRVTQATTSRDEEGRPIRANGSMQDVSDWRRAEREVQLLVGVLRTLGEWASFRESAEELVAVLARPLDALAGTIWVPRGDVLEPITVWMSRTLDEGSAGLIEATLRSRLPRGTASPVALGKRATRSRSRRASSSTSTGADRPRHSAWAVPSRFRCSWMT